MNTRGSCPAFPLGTPSPGPRVAALIPAAGLRRGLVRTSSHARPHDPHLSARYREQTLLCFASGLSGRSRRSPEPGCVAASKACAVHKPHCLQLSRSTNNGGGSRLDVLASAMADAHLSLANSLTKNGPLRTRILPCRSIKQTTGSYQFKV